MTNILRPGTGILFMKVGTHAQESLEQIIERKTKEIQNAGYALWGYGGNTCHPRTMVQPFAKAFQKQGQSIYLCMEEMNSKHYAQPIRADQFSSDLDAWIDIPTPINVLGSRYALVIDDLHEEKFDLSLTNTRVAIGPNQGRPGHRYLKGQVDKACLEYNGELVTSPDDSDDRQIQIGLVANLVEPYAVFLRNRP